MKTTTHLLPLILALAACGADVEKPKEAPLRLEGDQVILAEPDKASFLKTAAVEVDTGSELRLPGRLVWNEDHTVRVFPQLGGRVLKLQAEVGSAVKAGQALATLASPDYGQAEADVRKARADLELSRKARERSKELLDAGVIARKDWEQAEADTQRAQAEADRASRRMTVLGGEGDGTYVLRSPLNGTVVEKSVNPGQEFRPDQAGPPMFVVTDPTALWIQLDASEGDVGVLRPGGTFTIEAKQYPGEQFQGVIRHVADFVDPDSRTVKVRGEVANAARKLKGEMFVTARIALPASERLRVPAKAVFLLGDKRYVFVDEGGGRYQRRPVEAGAEREGWIEVRSGLKVGEKVVTEGNLHLTRFFKPEPAGK